MLDLFQLENMRYRWRQWVCFDCNWKTAIEAFTDAAADDERLGILDDGGSSESRVRVIVAIEIAELPFQLGLHGLSLGKTRTGRAVDMPLTEIWTVNGDQVDKITAFYFDATAV